MQLSEPSGKRWELYKVLGDPLRLRLLAVSSVEELAIGELAELLGESQPNVSRHVAPLRKLGLLAERKQGTRVLVRLADDAREDAVVSDAITAGRTLCEPEGTLERIAELVKRRDQPAREFFARAAAPEDQLAFPAELPAYLAAVAPLMSRRELAVDVGTGEGRLLDVLAPLFKQVIAVDREPAQLAVAKERIRARGYQNVQLLAGELVEPSVRAAVTVAGLFKQVIAVDREPAQLAVAKERIRARGYQNVQLLAGELVEPSVRAAVTVAGLADAVFASRVLHHAPRPAEIVRGLARLVRPGGALIVLDYAPHDDETMREQQADLWLGFAPTELARFASEAGLCDVGLRTIPRSFCGAGPDRHLSWQLFTARRDGAARPSLNPEPMAVASGSKQDPPAVAGGSPTEH
jgi:ArsR family transcriptional regulator